MIALSGYKSEKEVTAPKALLEESLTVLKKQTTMYSNTFQ